MSDNSNEDRDLWNRNLKRFAVSVPLIIIIVGLLAYTLSDNPGLYCLFIVINIIGAAIAIKLTWH